MNKYTQSDGLSSYFITKFIRDPYGFLWVGTQEGLDLFDGINFRVYSPQSSISQRLGGSFISDLAIDIRRNLIWVLTSYGDVCGIDLATREVKRRIAADASGRPLSAVWLRSLSIQGDRLWIAGLGELLCYALDTDRFLPIDLKAATGFDPGYLNIAAMTTDETGRLWMFADGVGIVMLAEKRGKPWIWNGYPADTAMENPANLRTLRFWSTAREGSTIYVGTSRGLLAVHASGQGSPATQRVITGLSASTEVFGVAAAPDRRLLYSTAQGVYLFSPATGRSSKFQDSDDSDGWLTLTYEIYYDPQGGKVWLGTQSGLASFDPQGSPFAVFGKSSSGNDRIKHAYSLYPVNDRMVYCGDENGVFVADLASRVIEKIGTMGSNLLLFGDSAGNIFLSNKSGFFLVEGRVVRRADTRFPATRRFGNDQFNSALCYNDSLILLGSVLQKGLSVWNQKTGTVDVYHRDSIRHPLSDLTIINNLYKTQKGKVFVLTEKAIVEFDPIHGTAVSHSLVDGKTRLPLTNFMDMSEMNGRYWIGTYGQGVIVTDDRFRIERIFTTQDGLSNNCVYKAFPYEGRWMLMTTNNGLSILDAKTGRIQTYYQSDGLHSSLFEQVCGAQSAHKIYAGGVNGFTVIEPGKIRDNPVPPQLYVNHVAMQTRTGISDTTDILLSKLEVPNDILQVTVGLSGLNYRNPTRTGFEYRIAEDRGKWISMHGQASFSLPALPPGTYTLLFRAVNESGVFSPRPVSLALVYLPKWFQTLWFRLSIVAAAMILLYSFYRYRLAQIQRQQAIRREIAGDLHDDIGSTLNSVKIFAHLARMEPEREEHLSNIEDFLSQASQGLRDMIWVLDTDEDNLYEILERVKKYAIPVCSAKMIRFETNLQDGYPERKLSKTVKRNLLLIAKEAINNSLKYAECSRIELGFRNEKDGPLLYIQDDGKGFDPNVASKGNGLKNIRERARQIQCITEIRSAPGAGTKIVVYRQA